MRQHICYMAQEVPEVAAYHERQIYRAFLTQSMKPKKMKDWLGEEKT